MVKNITFVVLIVLINMRPDLRKLIDPHVARKG